VRTDADRQIRRLGWLHFLNDFTLDFVSPLLPAGVGVAWLGAMEGVADAVGQGLKLVTGRASDRSGRRAGWVRGGYLVNAVARPLSAAGMVLGWPVWIAVCRVADRVGKGLRGSATDALVADWTEGADRARAFARMRVMDHLGATLGGAAAALAAWQLGADLVWAAVAALVAVTAAVAFLAKGVQDRPGSAPEEVGAEWWPRSPVLRRPLLAIGIASPATRISPLLVLAQVAGLPGEAWPLWAVCLGWAVLGLVQTTAAAFAGRLTAALGPAAMLRLGWIAGAAVMAGLGLASGAWLVGVGVAYGVLAGLTEGAEKTWLADLAPKEERARSFGAMSLTMALASLAGNAGCGALLARVGPSVFLAAAVLSVAGASLTIRSGSRASRTSGRRGPDTGRLG
jgi:MFS family permease